MSSQPTGGAPPGPALPAPAVPVPRAPAPAGQAAGPPGEPPEESGPGLPARLRAQARTVPGGLRVVAGLLTVLIGAFGVVASFQMAERSAAAEDVLRRSQPLSADAAAVYRSLADANTAASSGFLAGGLEPAEVRERYDRDIATASRKLVTAAAATDGSAESAAEIAELSRLLPVYTARIEAARANNRQGLPLGGAWLRNANDLMQEKMLPAAERLYQAEKERLRTDYATAQGFPWAAVGLGVLTVGALGGVQHALYRRTNRRFNVGLLGATAACGTLLLWVAAGHTLASGALSQSYEGGVRSLNVLNDARISALKARGGENLTLVARGAVTVPQGRKFAGQDSYDVAYRAEMARLLGPADTGEKRGGLLGQALELADDPRGRDPVRDAADQAAEWRERHLKAREYDEAGDYDQALKRVIGAERDEATGASFDRLDAALEKALAHEQGEFERAAGDGGGALTGLVAGALVLAVLGAAGAGTGIARRLAEYR
ncbi:hypothetical protein ACFWMQ_04620 [Streptomyces sp. NPDC058372]|uniref:hypothetical protein n=1 Tax=Streptomyces sp. NPDC058372 TaxID=3346464 RepID=UPI00365DBA0A